MTDSLIFMFFRRMRAPLIVLISAYAIATVGFTLMPGVDDQGQPWRMNLLEAFYVVSYTGSTIGFGEIPYEFTPEQRMWTIASIYLTVVAWLFSIGSIISLLQDPVYTQALRRARLVGSVRDIRQPFYLICGYGDTGRILTHALSGRGYPVVIIDTERSKIDTLAVEDLGASITAFAMDARMPDNLIDAGLRSRWCAGVIAVTGEEHANLKIATSAKLLNHKVVVHARANSQAIGDNMKSFDTDSVINPVDEFILRLGLAIDKPDLFRLYYWLASGPDARLMRSPEVPAGQWVVCGFGRVGRAIYRMLERKRIPVTVVDEDPQGPGRPAGTVEGRGTQAETLRLAGIDAAAVIVAATGDDADNLSILMTARALNPKLFTAALENGYSSHKLFSAAEPDLIGRPSAVVAGSMLGQISSSLFSPFVEQLLEQDNDFARDLLMRLLKCQRRQPPEFTAGRISARRAPTIARALEQGTRITIGTLLGDPRDRRRRLPLQVLFLQRKDEGMICPAEDVEIELGDRVLLAGRERAALRMRSTLENDHTLDYLLTGQDRQHGWVWQWFEQRFGSSAS